MKEKPMVSVIMATYNTDELYLKESINSILNQTLTSFELIIVCDGSEKDYHIIKEISDSRIVIIRHTKNCGLAKSLNDAIKIAKGKYIARMDSDDISVPQRLEMQVNYMENNPEIDLCSTYAEAFGNDTRKIINFFTTPEYIAIQNLYYSAIIHPTVLFRKTVFSNKKFLYDINFKTSQDFDLWSRMINQKKIKIIPKIGLKYRSHDNQISLKKRETQIAACEKIFKRNAHQFFLEIENEAYHCFRYLNGLDPINCNNINQLSELIDKLIIQNKFFETKKLKNVLYNRFLIFVIKNKISLKFYLKKSFFKKIFNFCNFKYIFFYLIKVK